MSSLESGGKKVSGRWNRKVKAVWGTWLGYSRNTKQANEAECEPGAGEENESRIDTGQTWQL